jgi:hypothetical protein
MRVLISADALGVAATGEVYGYGRAAPAGSRPGRPPIGQP